MLTAKPMRGSIRSVPKSFLGAMATFKNVVHSGLQEIEKAAIEKRYAKGESLFLEDDRAEFVWFVKEGHVKEVVHTAEGRNLTLSMMGVGGLFGTGSFGEGKYGCHAMAETDTTVILFPIGAFQALMGKYPEMARAVVAEISMLLWHSKDMQTFAQESAEKRILHVLLDLVREFGSSIPLTRREIGEMAGTTVETSIRVLSKLEDAGLISSLRGKVVIKDLRLLTERMEAI